MYVRVSFIQINPTKLAEMKAAMLSVSNSQIKSPALAPIVITTITNPGTGPAHRQARQADVAAARVKRQRAVTQGRRGQALRAAYLGAQPGQQFFHVKGLGQVVVRARVDTGDFFMPLAVRREAQDRHGLALAAPALQHAQAIQHRQAEVEHGRVIGLDFALVAGVASLQGGVDRVAGARQRRAQLGRPSGFVFSDQDAHEPLFVFAAGSGRSGHPRPA